MNRAFKLALGLAAIDGLSSAFVGLLLLALTLIGSGEGAPPTNSDTSVLFLDKSVNSSAAMHVRMLLAVFVEDQTSPVFVLPAQNVGLSPVENVGMLTDNGSVLWGDCESDRSTCTSQLVINKPNTQPRCWILSLRAATTSGAYSDQYYKSVSIRPTMFVNGKKYLLRTNNGTVVLGIGSSMNLRIDPRKNPAMEITSDVKCADWKKS